MRFVALGLLLVVACSPGAPPPRPAKALLPSGYWSGKPRPDACKLVLAEVVEERLVRVADDGTPTVLGTCANRVCVDGDVGVRVTALVGAPAEITFAGRASAPLPAGDPRYGTRFPGVVVGHRAALLAAPDPGAALVLVDATTGTARSVPRATLADDDVVDRLAVVDDGVSVRAGKLRAGIGPCDGDHWQSLVGPRIDPSTLVWGDKGVQAHVVRTDAGLVVEETSGARHPLTTSPGPQVVARIDDRVLTVFASKAIGLPPATVEVLPLDGGEGFLRELPDAVRVFATHRGLLALHPLDGLLRVERDGFSVITPRIPGHDLSGGPIPDDATLELVELSPHGDRALVFERIRTVTCEIEDRVSLLDGMTGTFTAVKAGRGLRGRALFALDAFHFIESDAVARSLD